MGRAEDNLTRERRRAAVRQISSLSRYLPEPKQLGKDVRERERERNRNGEKVQDRGIMNEETRIKWQEFETSSETSAKKTFSKVHFGRKGVGYLTEQCHT